MTEERKSSRRLFWGISLALALAVHAAGLLLFQLGDGEANGADADLSFVTLPPIHGEEGEGDLWREQAYLRDSAPLFLPTRWNAASSPPVLALERRPPDLFDPFPAHLSFEETDFGLGAISAVNPGTALQNLSSFGDISHATFGEMQLETPPLVARFALLEVFSPAGELVTARVLPLDGAPPAGEQLWRPAEFLLQVTAVGVVGEPVLLQGSGSEAVDLFLRDSIRRLSRLRMLDPGYYRVLGGP